MFPIGKKTGFHLTMLLYRKICAFSSYTVIAIHFSLFTELPCSICSWAGFCILFWHLPRILHMARGSCHRSHVFSYIVDVWPYVMRLVVALWPRWPFWGVIWEDSKPSKPAKKQQWAFPWVVQNGSKLMYTLFLVNMFHQLVFEAPLPFELMELLEKLKPIEERPR